MTKKESQDIKKGPETKQCFNHRINVLIRLKIILPQIQNNRTPNLYLWGESQTTHHLLYDCKLYNKDRTQVRYIVTQNRDRWSIKKSTCHKILHEI